MERIIKDQPKIVRALRVAGCKRSYLAMLANIVNARLYSDCSIESTIAIWRERRPDFFN